MKNLKSAAFLLLFGFANVAHAQLIANFTPASPFLAALPGGATVSGQTFTAGFSATVGIVTVLAQSVGPAPTSITFELRSVSGGLPTAAILAAVSVPGNGLTTNLASFSADFSSQSVFLTGGGSYALTLRAPTLFGLGGAANGYAGGAQVTSSGPSFVFFAPPRDLGFSVAQAPALVAVPEPSVYSLGGVIALIGIFARARFRKREGV
jgi:hypothetical protein